MTQTDITSTDLDPISTRAARLYTTVDPIYGDTAYLFAVHTVDTDLDPDRRYTRTVYRAERNRTGFAGRQWSVSRRQDPIDLTGGRDPWQRVGDDLPSRDACADRAEHDAYLIAATARAMRLHAAPRVPEPSPATERRWAALFALGGHPWPNEMGSPDGP